MLVIFPELLIMLQTTNLNIVTSLHLLWEERSGLDGLFVCRDGSVPFSRLVVASHSPVLAALLASASLDSTEEETQKIVLNSFRSVTSLSVTLETLLLNVYILLCSNIDICSMVTVRYWNIKHRDQ